jgi:hypothetical protein
MVVGFFNKVALLKMADSLSFATGTGKAVQ